MGKRLFQSAVLLSILIAADARRITAAEPAAAVAAAQVSHERGLYTRPFHLTLTTATPGAAIRYTLDGSLPTESAGTPYTGPITIGTSTVVHAIAFAAGRAASPVVTASYLFPAKVLQQPPTIAGYPNPPQPINNPGPNQVTVPLMYGMNPVIVADPKFADAALKGLSQIPSISIGVDRNRIFGPDGFYDTPRRKDGPKVPISFEFIDPKRPKNNVGLMAVITAHSKQKLKRSFHLKFGKKYGGGKLKAKLFDTAPLGGDSATDTFSDLILRGGNNRSWAAAGSTSKTTYTEDEFVRQTQVAMTGHGVHGTFVHLYLNGIYWGLYNLVERPDEGFGEAYFDSDKDAYFSLNQNGPNSGDPARWNTLMNTLIQKDLSVPAHYAEIRQYLDVKQFADYLIGQWFCAVSDWPDRNYWAGGDTAKKQPFRFYAWDGEEILDTANRFPKVPHGPWVNPAFAAKNPINNTGPIVELWNALKKSPEFMALFKEEVDRNLAPGGPLSDANVQARWDKLNESISDAVVNESARWGDVLVPTGRPVYKRDNAWVPATQMIRRDLTGAGEKFKAALRAEGYYP